MGDRERASAKALEELLHAERHSANTYDVDCWACEAVNSPVIKALIREHVEARASASHAHAVLARAVPDEEDLAALWRDHWREVLASKRQAQAAVETPASATETGPGRPNSDSGGGDVSGDGSGA